MTVDPFAGIEGLEVRRDELMKAHTTFRVGGPADYFLVPTTPDALAAALRRATEAAVPAYVLGGGTNLLVADAGFRGAIVVVERNLSELRFNGDRVVVDAGVRLPALAARTIREGLAGMEPLAGVPGTVGGALGINAGAFGAEFCDLVLAVDGFTFEGEPRRYEAREIAYGYRSATYPDVIVFAGAVLRLTEDDPVEIGRRAAEIRATRARSQPTRSKSAGCAFRNPDGGSAGRSIDQAGLKGFRVGGAEVSDVHANYLVNLGDATAEDIRRLIEEIQVRVRRSLSVELQAEVRMLGFEP